jgi:Putative transposase of IS4/5 family (DUF4096)
VCGVERRADHGIMHVLKSGGLWSDCPEPYPPPTTNYNCFARWAQYGILEILFQELAKVDRWTSKPLVPHVKVDHLAQRIGINGLEAGRFVGATKAQGFNTPVESSLESAIVHSHLADTKREFVEDGIDRPIPL